MNPKLQKIYAEIGKTETKIAELQAHLDDLGRKRIVMENDEIIRQIRATVKPEDLPAFLAAYGAKSGTPHTATDIRREEDVDDGAE